jgi:hypothetical protein
VAGLDCRLVRLVDLPLAQEIQDHISNDELNAGEPQSLLDFRLDQDRIQLSQ